MFLGLQQFCFKHLHVAVVISSLFLLCDLSAQSIMPYPSIRTIDHTSVKSIKKHFMFYNDILVQISKQKALQSYISKFSDNEKIAQLFMINIDGSTIFTQDNDFNEGLAPGAFLFFSFNIANTAQNIISFTDSVYEYYDSSIPPFLTIDHEGGMVHRLRSITSPLASQLLVSSYCSLEESKVLYKNAAKQLKMLGFSFNLAPVVEPLLDLNQSFLLDRSYGSIQDCISYSSGMINEYSNQGLLCAVKHFPGNTNADPHIGLPVISLSKNDFYTIMIEPFKKILKNVDNKTAVLLSHAVVPEIEENVPACFSQILVSHILRENLNFDGLILTDDIIMGAIADFGYDSNTAVEQAILAGADMIMSSQKRFIHLVDYLSDKRKDNSELDKRINQSFMRIIQAKIDTGILYYSQHKSYFFPPLPVICEVRIKTKTPDLSYNERYEEFSLYKQEGEALYSSFFLERNLEGRINGTH